MLDKVNKRHGEFVPLNWKQPRFQKPKKIPLPTYTRDELEILFDMVTKINEDFHKKIATVLGASRSFPVLGGSSIPLIQHDSFLVSKVPPLYGKKLDPFYDLNSFHKWIKNHLLKPLLKIPFSKLPLYINKDSYNFPQHSQPEKRWVDAIIQWRLTIGK